MVTEPAEDPESSAREAHLKGNRRATLHILVRAYGESLRRYCQRLLRDKELADDIYQTVLLQALADLPSFSGRSPFRVWLYAIARYRCMDTLKVSRSRSRYLVQQDEVPDVADPAETPEEQLVRLTRYAALRDALHRLPPKSRQALVLRYFEQLSYDEMARRGTDMAATLRVRVARALPQLRRLLEAESDEPA